LLVIGDDINGCAVCISIKSWKFSGGKLGKKFVI
jgi:hypothetical protein